MPLLASRLATALRAKVVLRDWAKDSDALTELCADIAAAVVEEIQANATVTVTTVTACGAGAGTGSGGGTVS